MSSQRNRIPFHLHSLARSRASNENHKEASKTYLEQTKLLIALASTFIAVPAVLFKDMVDISVECVCWMEGMFILSVLLGYVVVGSISGSQYDGKYDIYRRATRYGSILQLGAYLIGLVIMVHLFLNQKKKKEQAHSNVKRIDTVWITSKDTFKVEIIGPTYSRPKLRRRAKTHVIKDTCCHCKTLES